MEEGKQREALEKGEVQIRVKRSGMFQLLPFKLVRKKTSLGEAPYLVLDRFLDMSELIRISEEYGLPVESPAGRIFPRGKKESDFLGL